MTIDEMRQITGLGPEASDAAVVAVYTELAMFSGGTTAPPEIVTLEEVKTFCRLGSEAVDAELEILIATAIEAVLCVANEWDGSSPVPARIKLAVLMHVSRIYDNRQDGADMPPSATRLLGPMRRLEV